MITMRHLNIFAINNLSSDDALYVCQISRKRLTVRSKLRTIHANQDELAKIHLQ